MRSGAWERHRFKWRSDGTRVLVWGFNPLRGASAGALIRRRRAAGATRPRPAAGQASINALFVFAVLWGALLGLFWRLLREGRLKVARGRSWQPEIGMEHASRGRRSGNKGVGARWRGRFRIFSARHCSRTKVSHAENSGMTMLFFSLEVAPMSEGDSFTRSGVVRHACRHRVTARGVFVLGIVSHAREWRSGNAKRSFAGRIPKRSLGTTQN